MFFRISLLRSCPGFSGGTLRGAAAARSAPARSGRGVAPQAPGPFSRPEGRAPRSGVPGRTAVTSRAERRPARPRASKVLSQVRSVVDMTASGKRTRGFAARERKSGSGTRQGKRPRPRGPGRPPPRAGRGFCPLWQGQRLRTRARRSRRGQDGASDARVSAEAARWPLCGNASPNPPWGGPAPASRLAGSCRVFLSLFIFLNFPENNLSPCEQLLF